MKRAENLPGNASPLFVPMRLFILAITAVAFLFTPTAQCQPSVSEMLADTSSLGTGWDRKIYLQFDSDASPAEVIETIKAPPESALKEWRRDMRDPNGKISGWVLAHYNIVSSTNHPKYEVHLERYRSHDALLADFEKILEIAAAQPGSIPLTHIGDAAALVADPQGNGAKVWFRRGDFRVWISPIGAHRSWDQDASLHLLAQAMDQHIAALMLHARAAADGAALIKNTLEAAIRSPNPDAVKPQSVVKIGDAFFPISKSSSPEPVAIAFDHWGRQSSHTDALAVFRLTNSDSRSILLWNVRVQDPTTAPTISPSGWETIQDDYPSATSAVCEPGSSIEFWVTKPVMTPWRVCILYSRELSESDRPKDSQRSWGGNYEVIGQPVH